jgi:hypothetical protein
MKKKTSFPALLLLAMSLLFAACNIFESDSCGKEYYPVEGEGYFIFAVDSTPAPAGMEVCAYFERHGWATKQPIIEKYYADSKGYFRIRFLKQADCQEIADYEIVPFKPKSIEDTTHEWKSSDAIKIVFANKIQSSKSTIQLGTWKIYP